MAITMQEKIEKVQEDLGKPTEETKRKPVRENFLVQSSGDATFILGDMAWPKEGTIDDFDDPIPSLYFTVRGVNSMRKDPETGRYVESSFAKQFPLDGDLSAAKKMATFWQGVVKFLETTGVEIPSQTFEKNEITAAIEKYKKKK